jgi:hypothetical protein
MCKGKNYAFVLVLGYHSLIQKAPKRPEIDRNQFISILSTALRQKFENLLR